MNSKTITAAWLREHEAQPHGIIPLSASLGPMLADAIEIADSCARADIECHCRKVRDGDTGEGGHWYDVGAFLASEDSAVPSIHQAIAYLTARGLLEFDPRAPNLVRPLDQPRPE